MRRNFMSLLKFMLLCAIMVLLTIFLYKTFHYVQNIYHDGDEIASQQQQPFADKQILLHPRQGSFFMGANKNLKHLKIDWHDYKYIEMEKSRHGIGEHGAPASVSADEESERKRLFDQNGFNGLLSDKIALNRSVKDIRHKE